MKCPLFIQHDVSAAMGEETAIVECIKEGCGLYDQAGEYCAPVANNRIMTAIGNVLGKIADDLTRARLAFRCHYCGLTVTVTREDLADHLAGWTRKELIDGKHVYLCDRCSEEATE